MILNYVKYIFYTLILATIIISSIFVRSSLINWKDKAVKAALEEVKIQQKDITIGQQDNVIKQHSVAFKKTQQIAKESIQKNKQIESAATVPEKVKVKYEIIDEMNCRINNFIDDTICIKP